MRGIRSRLRCRCQELCHGGGPPHGIICRTARDLPQHPRPACTERGLLKMLCLSLYGPCHLLPHRQRLRPLQSGPVHRDYEDGPLRYGHKRCHVHTRYGDGLPRRCLHQRIIRSGGKHRPGSRQPRRILRLQAHIQEGFQADHQEKAGREEDQDDIRPGRVQGINEERGGV